MPAIFYKFLLILAVCNADHLVYRYPGLAHGNLPDLTWAPVHIEQYYQPCSSNNGGNCVHYFHNSPFFNTANVTTGAVEGPAGPMGAQGMPGPIGPPGIAGPPGQPGVPGRVGRKGDNGLPGPAGLAGPMGQKGVKGDVGYPGYPGDRGRRGLRGDPGQPGPKGSKGNMGPTGFGAKGVKGDMGKIGKPGPPGPGGPRGPRGERGDQGERGIQGEPFFEENCREETGLDCEHQCWVVNGVAECRCRKGWSLMKHDNSTCESEFSLEKNGKLKLKYFSSPIFRCQ